MCMQCLGTPHARKFTEPLIYRHAIMEEAHEHKRTKHENHWPHQTLHHYHRHHAHRSDGHQMDIDLEHVIPRYKTSQTLPMSTVSASTILRGIFFGVKTATPTT